MSAITTLQQRVAALEAEVAKLRTLLQEKEGRPSWENMVGAFANDPYYEKAMKLGRQYRESTRPKGSKKKTTSKETNADS